MIMAAVTVAAVMIMVFLNVIRLQNKLPLKVAFSWLLCMNDALCLFKLWTRILETIIMTMAWHRKSLYPRRLVSLTSGLIRYTSSLLKGFFLLVTIFWKFEVLFAEPWINQKIVWLLLNQILLAAEDFILNFQTLLC